MAPAPAPASSVCAPPGPGPTLGRRGPPGGAAQPRTQVRSGRGLPSGPPPGGGVRVRTAPSPAGTAGWRREAAARGAARSGASAPEMWRPVSTPALPVPSRGPASRLSRALGPLNPPRPQRSSPARREPQGSRRRPSAPGALPPRPPDQPQPPVRRGQNHLGGPALIASPAPPRSPLLLPGSLRGRWSQDSPRSPLPPIPPPLPRDPFPPAAKLTLVRIPAWGPSPFLLPAPLRSLTRSPARPRSSRADSCSCFRGGGGGSSLSPFPALPAPPRAALPTRASFDPDDAVGNPGFFLVGCLSNPRYHHSRRSYPLLPPESSPIETEGGSSAFSTWNFPEALYFPNNPRLAGVGIYTNFH